ncbi:zinc carboxypeptidase [Aquimarina sp. AD10]|uniref:M14 metallopeptidase family protein n=1 Tax=Aquimarina sp. AD10 TaxID=1714849 RepID=UPI000E483D27|nr:M14 metallopeptidase family protein [Aquimarina sp. AD10]AXT60636.1 zinc carboxypeptidase [Aquimarina sp. AD10]RKN01728.1 zinc carboxypeptidase [Aquimarina sp. AD10]
MKYIFTILLALTGLISQAQNDLSLAYYLPKNITYNPSIPTPQSVLGYVPGKWHVTHDKLVAYMTALADASPRITIENRGKTFEDRPILLLTITSEKNHQNLEQIKTKHVQLTEANSNTIDLENLPAIVYQGFSIHGNEASGSNSALLSAYYLAAAQGQEIDSLLNDVVILFDPSFNPDGLQRFSYWANIHKNKNISTDPQDREYSEVWPGGRTNHYWFDMNRDWLPVQLPESRARIATYHKWYPNILTDHHEMGSNSTFFFQPGIQSRTHPLTPKLNQKLTKKIANYHAKALDKIGSLYYTEENFDDFYYGKGSTFPDINGGIGILFEQASSRGHAQQTDNGVLTFPFTIRNQFTATLSTLEAAKSMRKELLTYKRNFYVEARKESNNNAYVFGNEKDAASSFHLAEILKRHKIKIHELKQDIAVQNKKFKKGYSFAVPKNQRHSRLIKAIFEKRTTFTDSLFYDISSWTFPLAFNLDYADNIAISNLGNEILELKHKQAKQLDQSNYGYLMEWHEYYGPKALYQILEKGLRAKVGMTPFTLNNANYDYGTILIPVQNQKLNNKELHEFLQKVSLKNHIDITAVSTGLTKGIDLGSNKFRPLSLPRIGLFTGSGITPYDAGEIWHLMDQRFDIPITKLDTDHFNRTNLARYTHIVLPNQRGLSFNKPQIEKLKNWIRSGGTLIGYRNIAQFFAINEFMEIEFSKPENNATNISFEQRQDFFGAQVIGGAIFEAKTDRSHPINFGYKNDKIPLFRNTTIFIKPNKQSYNNPIRYTKSPLLSGYISKKNLDSLSGTVPFRHKNFGRGNVILFTDNTNFRAFWYGTNKLLMNAIFFSDEM